MELIKNQLRLKSLKNREYYYKSYISTLTSSQYTSLYESYFLKIITILSQTPQYTVISGFYPIKHEPDCLFLLKKLKNHGFETCLPFIKEKSKGTPMIFRKYNENSSNIIKDAYGIYGPDDMNEIIEPHIFITPLLAFDENMMRLGYGGGFYDRYLSKMRK